MKVTCLTFSCSVIFVIVLNKGVNARVQCRMGDIMARIKGLPSLLMMCVKSLVKRYGVYHYLRKIRLSTTSPTHKGTVATLKGDPKPMSKSLYKYFFSLMGEGTYLKPYKLYLCVRLYLSILFRNKASHLTWADPSNQHKTPQYMASRRYGKTMTIIQHDIPTNVFYSVIFMSVLNKGALAWLWCCLTISWP